MERKQCKLKRSIPNLFQFIVQVSLSQFPRAPTTIAPILFVIFVIVFAFGITVSWLELTPPRSDFKCLSSSQEQSSSSLDNNLNSLTPGTIATRNENGYNTLSGTWKSSTFWCRDFTFSGTDFVKFVKKSSHLEQRIKNLVYRETVLPRRWGYETWIFGIQRVDWVRLITTVKRLQGSLLQR